MSEITVNGRRVVLRERLPARECWPLIETLRVSQREGREMTYDEEVRAMATLIESWEFEGDPHDPSAYEALDLFEEYLPLSGAIGANLIERMTGAKN